MRSRALAATLKRLAAAGELGVPSNGSPTCRSLGRFLTLTLDSACPLSRSQASR